MKKFVEISRTKIFEKFEEKSWIFLARFNELGNEKNFTSETKSMHVIGKENSS